jgi:hypothetical protein
LLDAIAHRKPLIVTDIPFARDLFDRFGDLGDLCRTDEDAVNAIKRAASAQDPARYRRQVENLGRVARSREISALAPRLRAIIESIA